MKRKIKKFMEKLQSVSVEEGSVAEVDIKLLEKFPKNVREGLKTFAKTNDLLYSAEIAGVPYTVFNNYRIKAGLRWVI
ncbi:hypothetical protein BEH94_08875 [Candidatus Altiarchaeales archaeon WOR_SM1_SCG]|nr:hypothetical protein BEH94_08875 [Candidatus Altiarchaeales archaeon WOR_SM1_SCG]